MQAIMTAQNVPVTVTKIVTPYDWRIAAGFFRHS